MPLIGVDRCIRLLTVLALSLPASGWSQETSSEAGAASPDLAQEAGLHRHSKIEDVLGPFHKFEPHDESVAQGLTQQRQKAPIGADTAARVLYWNEVMLDANGRDHTPGLSGQPFGEQLGPHRTSRAFAIVQIAVFDAVNAVRGGYRSYTGLEQARRGASVDAAVALAAHDTLAALYPSQRAIFDVELAADLARIRDGEAKREGSRIGQRAAQLILTQRENDGSHYKEPTIGVDYLPDGHPGKWRPDPVSASPLAVGAYWGQVKPFVIRSAQQFEAQPVPPLTSLQYAAAFDEVKRLGGDGITTPTARTGDQTVAGIYWGYDGTPGLGTPPRLFNQIAVQLAQERGVKDALKLARLLALINVAQADTAIAVWNSKFEADFWRPITAIRTAYLDGNPATSADLGFTPLGAPASNLSGPNFTPPFPAYPSGHAGLASSFFQTLRKFFGTDRIAFTFVSDEWNGVTRDNHGSVRPRIPRSFASLSEAEEEAGQSRIYLGIHWHFDKTGGFDQGRRIADYVYVNAFLPAGRRE